MEGISKILNKLISTLPTSPLPSTSSDVLQQQSELISNNNKVNLVTFDNTFPSYFTCLSSLISNSKRISKKRKGKKESQPVNVKNGLELPNFILYRKENFLIHDVVSISTLSN